MIRLKKPSTHPAGIAKVHLSIQCSQFQTGGISLRDIEDLITEIGYQCPWYLEKGSLDLGDWIKIRVHLHPEPRAPIQHLLLWQTCKEAVETVGVHSLKAPASLLPQEASAPSPYVQLTLLAPTSMLSETSRTPPKTSSKGSSAIQAGFKEAQEKGELRSEELTEGLNAFPVQERIDAQGQIQYEWTPLPYTTGGISLRDIEDLITEIGYQCPWYPEKGSLDLGDWIKIGVHLHPEPRAPIQHLLLWQTCKEAVETVGVHSLKAPASLLPQEASAPSPYVQLTLPAPTSMLSETSRTPPKTSSKGSSAIQAGFKEAQEKGELTSEELTEGLNAFPVQERIDAQGQIQYEWTPLPYT
ncbi:hypothetical protein E2320_002955, partial [Naja naja]